MLREQKLYCQYDGPGDGKVVQQLVIPECKKTEVLKEGYSRWTFGREKKH